MALGNREIAAAKETVFEAAITKLDNEMSAAVPDPMEIETQLQVVRSKYESLLQTMDKIMEQNIAEGNDQQFIEDDNKRSDLFRKVQRAEFKAAKALNDLNPPDPVAAVFKPVSNRSNLPQRKLQEFSGDVREWLGFWSSFEDIDQDKGISDADKFDYLLQCVPKTSTARKCIEGFTVSAKNYRAAIDTLRDLYGRDRMLIKVYVRDLLQLVIENATRGAKIDFMELYPKLSSHIRNLEELGVTSDKCEEILYPVVESCLPEDIMLAWQRHPNYEEKLQELMRFLNTEVHNKMDRTLAKMQFSAEVESVSSNKRRKGNPVPADIPTAAGFQNVAPATDNRKQKEKIACVFCDDTRHKSQECGKAKSTMSIEDKMSVLRSKRCCYKCLRPNSKHMASKCKTYVKCCICQGNHYEIVCSGKKGAAESKMMMAAGSQYHSQYQQPCSYGNFVDSQVHHAAPPIQPQQQQPMAPPPPSPWMNRQDVSGPQASGMQPKTGMSNFSSKGKVTLKTLTAIIETPKGQWRVRIFVDDGSEESYIRHDLAVNTGCKQMGNQMMQHQLFGGVVTAPQNHPQFEVRLMSLDRRNAKSFVFNSVPRIATKISRPQAGDWMSELQKAGIFVDDQSAGTDDVHIMIGTDIAAQIYTGGFHRINPYLYAKETTLGWVIAGTQQSLEVKTTRTNMVTTMMLSDHSVEDLWSLEILGIMDDPQSKSKEDMELATVKYFEDTIRRQDDGRYVVQLPWKSEHRKLASNYNQVFARLQNTTKELKSQAYWSSYDKIFRDWESDGIIEEVQDSSPNEMKKLYLLPHRHVVKENSCTTPVRPVFDASSKSKGAPSLNECIEKGPNLLELIPAIMCRFRKFKVGAVSDIKKAFLQIVLAKEDQEKLQFLWWKDESCKELKLYRHLRVVFGVTTSPFLLGATLKYHVGNCDLATEDMKKALLNSLYVDNSCSSHHSLQEAVNFKEKAEKILLPAHFDLRGWEFSHSEEEKVVPVLGMQWETKSDTISLCLESTKKKINQPATKRGILSIVNSVFDPLGYACAFTIIPKILLQECCKLKLGWDDALPDELAVKLRKWKSQLLELERMKIPRWVNLDDNNVGVSIHTFCDASTASFACSIYLRKDYGDRVETQLVMSKSRVAPLQKKVTIPRLELLACDMGAKLTKKVLEYMELEEVPLFFWTDSTTALAWITGDKPWARFVQNRVNGILKLTKKQDWYHVPGELNPADIPSRGCSAAKLVEMKYWEGPEWLRMSIEHWPNQPAEICQEEVNEEAKKTVVSSLAKVVSTSYFQRVMNFADYHKSLRVIAYVLRYVDALKRRIGVRQKLQLKIVPEEEVPPPTLNEVERGEKCIWRMIQHSSFNGKEDQRISKMGAFKDEEGIIRVKSQLLFGNDKFGVRCPIVLPHKHPMVNALIMKAHELSCHVGVQTLQCLLRKRFWILRSRRTISGVTNACPTCKRFTAKRCGVPCAPLPYDRIRDAVVFEVTGVDLAGPLTLRGGQKVWVVLFTCAVYRAVHLELVSTLSTEGFLNAFRRFVARRGRPTRVYSDNGRNFVGCNNLFKNIDWNEVIRYATVEKISWRFNPPTAAWWGGWWERLVGLMKHLLRKILGKRVADYEELVTLLCDVEETLNQRPLTFVSDEKEVLSPLCPVNFMRDNPHMNLPEADVIDSSVLRGTAKLLQENREKVRIRFRREYLALLRFNTGLKTVTVKPGDVVIIEDDNKKRLDWTLGVIREVYPGRDGIIRTALVKTKDGEFLRAVQRLFLMEVAEPEIKEDSSQEKQSEEKEKVTRSGRKIIAPDRLGIK